MQRREFIHLGAALGMASLVDAPFLLGGCAGPARSPDANGAASGEGIRYFRRFGIDEKMLKETLAVALSRGGDYADVFVQHSMQSSMSLEDGAVNRAYVGSDLGAGVRVVKGDQTGYGYTEELTPAALKKAAETAAAIASGPSRAAPTAFRAVSGVPQRYALQRAWDQVGSSEKLPILTKLNEQTFGADPRIKKVSVSIADDYGAVLLADSNGRIVEDVQPMVRVGLSCTAEDGGRREENGWSFAGRSGFEFCSDDCLSRLVKEVVARTMILFEAAPPPVGEMPVVLGAGGSGILLHEAIGHGMEADFNRKNISIYSDKLNKPIAKPFVNIVDDGTVDHARGAINVDDEGVVAQNTHLVENGVLTTYLHDSISAKHYGVKPTGNGRRESFRHVPMPRMRATYMLPGPHKEEEIIRSVKKGIYCKTFRNGQVNIGAGDFTFFVKNGFLIEDGKLTRPIKDVNLIGNGPKVLELVDMVADNLVIDEGGWTCGKNGQSVPVSQGIPTVRVSSITVGGRQS